jgi:hypothetical protein
MCFLSTQIFPVPIRQIWGTAYSNYTLVLGDANLFGVREIGARGQLRRSLEVYENVLVLTFRHIQTRLLFSVI